MPPELHKDSAIGCAAFIIAAAIFAFLTRAAAVNVLPLD